jgi:hypothetical protein
MPPHVVGEYNTVNNGRLQYFCTGVSGDGIKIKINKYVPGNPYYPAVVVGEYEEAETEPVR